MHERYLNDELKMFRDSAREWLRREVVPHHETWERDGICPAAIYKRAGEQGFLLLTQSSDFGGQGLDFRFSAVLTEELALVGATGLPLWLHSDIIAPYIENFGNNAQKKKYLPAMASGEKISAIAMTEPGTGSDLQGIKTSAIKKGEEWVLNGAKTFISNGINSSFVIVAARTAEAAPSAKYTPLTLFIVDKNTPGFQVGRKLEKMGLKAQDTVELAFVDCRVPESQVLGEPGKGFTYLTKNLAEERLCMAVHSVAAARYALKLTLDYVKTREAFSKKIADFQITRHRLADMAIEIEVCQAYVDQCVMDAVEKRDIAVAAAMAKVCATEMLDSVVDAGVQLFGGYGYMLEYPISRAYTDSRAQRIFGGTSEIMREIISRKILE